MQILNGRAGLGPMSEAKAHALLLRAAHSLCAASAWLARTPAASRINGGGGPRGHSPPSPPCSCSCWCSRASATCYSPPRDQSGHECGLHHSWAPIRFSELAPRFAREGGVQRSPSHAGLACSDLAHMGEDGGPGHGGRQAPSQAGTFTQQGGLFPTVRVTGEKWPDFCLRLTLWENGSHPGSLTSRSLERGAHPITCIPDQRRAFVYAW